MTPRPTPLLAAVTTHVDTVGATRSAARACRHWVAASSALSYPTPAALADAGRAAPPSTVDEIVTALSTVGGEWADLCTVAVLAPRLTHALRVWAAAGATRQDLADLEADLVCQTLAAVHVLPPEPPGGAAGWAVRRAWGATRSRHATTRRRDAHRAPFPDSPGVPVAAGDDRSGEELLACVLRHPDVRSAATRRSRQALFLTRVAGHTPGEAGAALGSSPGSVRALRSRAAQAAARCGMVA